MPLTIYLMSNRSTQIWKIAGISVLLIGLAWLVFAQTLRYPFVNYDDGAYVYRNPHVTHGLTLRGIAWAFSHAVAANWHPLTVISHMLDCHLYGVNAGGHHFTNVLLHTIAVVLLFLVLSQLTGGPSRTGTMWPSAFVSAVFAIHPLRVESVAWVAERKDVLSGVFFMLTLLAYFGWTQKRTFGRYVTMSILFALGLVSKPMLVTLPFVLLLLDYWPLSRFQRSEVKGRMSETKSTMTRLVVEKIPLFILSAATCAVVLVTQNKSESMAGVRVLPLPWRIENAFVAYATYVCQMIWPLNLAVLYRHPHGSLPLWKVALSLVFLILISAGAVISRKRRPYFFTGWFWYLGMLVPVIGIVQVGLQARADRYTYLPQIGLYLAITWAAADVSRPWRDRRIILSVTATAIVAALAWCARIQASYWRDSESLWRHTLGITADNGIAREHLCDALLDKNKVDEATAEAREMLQKWPASAKAQNILGVALTRQGHPDEALAYLLSALKLNPDLIRLHYNLANVLLQKGQVDQAIAHYKKELEAHPDFAEGHNNLANALFQKGEPDEALIHLETALELKPNYAEARNNLGIALSQKGEMREAIAEWTKALEIDPDNLDAHCNLAWVLATFPDASVRDGSKALEFAKRALQLSRGKSARIWRLAAAAYAETGHFPDAIDAAQKALRLADAQGNSALATTLEMNIALFQENLPLRAEGQPSVTPRR
jgi:tetratricopeptide (TPR) repeat protein